ncbi:MAG TPA: 50S ribosomal protein L3 N(5)-glutamine methyltransferase [Spongiibacteraceae bacterium]|jgi:ribosomal protein L3 glutamine methyltransferase|nr:50S ribosomal protein L3 N(5)-glutamine methyltransferase [Spongiibacteraceae bacterium]HUH37975.1 50S ribosomal protein L3 N(5)-glutamine methyltransferase [Spongiibacteraceae bacterium]
MLEASNQVATDLHTIRDYLRWALTQFQGAGLYFGHGTDNAYDDALQLILHVLQLPYDIDPAMLDCRLTRRERELVLVNLCTRIEQRIPVPYLTGEAWFAGLKFKVDERVLIPRSPIAELIEQGFQPWLGAVEPRRILDLCTGSGCIGIACALAFADAHVDLTDLSPDALEVARVNVARYALEPRVELVQSDLFAGLAGRTYELIVSNPPYVDCADMAALPAEYLHEPALALASGDDGLDAARQIVAQARQFLAPGGLLVLEVGNSWPALEAAFPELPFTWLEFERGGHGILAIHCEDLPDVL